MTFGRARRAGNPAEQERALVGSVVGLSICAAAVALRFYLSWRAPVSHDLRWYWAAIGRDLERGARLYDTPYHFSPVWSWLLLAFRRVARSGIPFHAALRTFLTVADVLSAWLLFRIARREELGGWRWKAPVLFLTNPVGIWVSSVQGQFDNLALLFLMAAVLVSAERERREWRTPLRVGFLLFLSVAAKQVTVFHPILWVRRRHGLAIALIAYFGTAALFLPYARQWRAILDRLLFYGSVPRSYGFSEFVLYDHRWAPFIGMLDAAAALAAAWALGKEPLPRASLLLFLVILIFAPGLGSQYLIWPLAFGALFGGARYFLFTGASILWTLGYYYRTPGSGQWMGHLVWLCAGLWAIGELRGLRHPGRLAKILRGDADGQSVRIPVE